MSLQNYCTIYCFVLLKPVPVASAKAPPVSKAELLETAESFIEIAVFLLP